MQKINKLRWDLLSIIKKSGSPEKVFLIASITFGLAFVFLFPPFQVIDEPSHFFRAYQISQGHLLAESSNDTSGGYLPTSVVNTAGSYGYLIFKTEEKNNPEITKHNLSLDLNPGSQSYVDFKNTAIYPPITYLPQVLAIKLTSSLAASPLIIFYATRMMALIFWILLTWYAIKLIPIGKWAFVLLSLMPMSLSQAASVSADATINALSFLFISLIVYAWYRPLSNRLTALLLLLSSGLALTKLPYFLLVTLLLTVPRGNILGALKSSRTILAGIVTCCILIAGGWNILTLPSRVDLRPDTSTTQQVAFVLHHPDKLLAAFSVYPLTNRMDFTIISFYGLLGWNDVRLPNWMMILGYLILFLNLTNPFEKKKRHRNLRIVFAATFFAISIAIIGLIYLSWVTVGELYMFGIWGRYFIAISPLLIPSALGLLFKLTPRSKVGLRKANIVWVFLSLAITGFLVWNRYYCDLQLGNLMIY